MTNTLTHDRLTARRKKDFNETEKMRDNTESPNTLPEMKINFSGEVLWANHSAEKLLRELGAESRWQNQLFFSVEFPYLLKPGCFTDIEINTENYSYCFSAVSFDEEEYVGLHCYRIIKTNAEKNSESLNH
jgi:hypothetical protein